MKEKAIMYAFFAVLVGLMVCLLPFATPPFVKWKLMVFVVGEAICGTTLLYMFFAGLTTIGQEERAVIEVLSRFSHVDGPGLIWVCPGFMKIRAIIDTWEQAFPLFKDGIWIDFKDGRAQPTLAMVFLRVKSPATPYDVFSKKKKGRKIYGEMFPGAFRMIYLVNDWAKRAVELTENTVRSYLATLEVDEALEGEKGGFNLLEGGRIPLAERKKLEKALAYWGLEVSKITIGDFNLPEEVMKTRDTVQQAAWKAEAAKAECEEVANETTGTFVHMIAALTGEKPEEVQDRFASSEEMEESGRAFAQDLVCRQLSLRHNALRDVRANTGSALGDLTGLVSGLFSQKQDPVQVGKPAPTQNANPAPA
jgi:regulator of protease activity HflC (stomatin/prohibitin superfamily)